MQPEDFWFSAPKKGIMVFALPGEPGLTELAGDFKIQFHDRQGDFYWYARRTTLPPCPRQKQSKTKAHSMVLNISIFSFMRA